MLLLPTLTGRARACSGARDREPAVATAHESQRSVVVAAVAGLALAAAGIHSLSVPLAFGAVVGAGALTLHQRHHRRARDTYTPEGVDRAAIFVPSSPQADTA